MKRIVKKDLKMMQYHSQSVEVWHGPQHCLLRRGILVQPLTNIIITILAINIDDVSPGICPIPKTQKPSWTGHQSQTPARVVVESRVKQTREKKPTLTSIHRLCNRMAHLLPHDKSVKLDVKSIILDLGRRT